ncbi:MAG: TIGR04282 family arsenosugar biosynthesis glycosyltransferase [Nitrospiraceae bacterium]|nr:TIGR04282 family arsenosugar biosynthesis glycosyltransferase [Nitrospiraceae bacterium]
MKRKEMLGLIAKYPEPGLVKTRLAREVGGARAARICRLIAEMVFRRTAPEAGGYDRVIFCDAISERALFETWLPGEKLLSQRGGDIGAIMKNALEDLFAAGAERAVIAGVDVPWLERRIVRSAFTLLGKKDVVIGPALDGGYYLIGMTTVHSALFHDIPWSAEGVFKETVRAVERLGLRYGTLETLSDVDCVEDIGRFPDLIL